MLPPALALLALSALQPPAPGTERMPFATERVALSLNPRAGAAIDSLRDPATGREYAAPQAAPRLFALEVSQAGDPQRQRITLSSREAAAVTSGADGRLVFEDVGGRDIDVTCAVRPGPAGDPHVRWGIEVKLGAGLVLESVRYPILPLRAPLGDGLEDAWVAGATKGGVYRRPSAWAAGKWVGFGQPGSLAAQFGCVYDVDGGVVTFAEDPVGAPKTVTLGRTGEGLELLWYHPCFAQGSWRLGYQIATTTFRAAEGPTDWRHAADLYKAWAVRQPWCARTLAQRDDLPPWLRAAPAHVRFNRGWLAEDGRIERWLREYWQAHFPAGTPLITSYWGWEKVDTWVTPDYFPVYPSDERFRQIERTARAMDAHAFFWPSGYHYTVTFKKKPDGSFEWDDRQRFDAEARAHAVVGRDGNVIIGDRSWLQGGQTATMCPGDPWTRDWFTRIGVECARRGVELVQVDQVVGGGFPPCYSTTHGHPPGPGPWMAEAFERQLEALGMAVKALEPQAVIGVEEPNEHFIHQVGIQDYRDWEVMTRGDAEPASVFNYVYHEYLPTFQSNPRAGDRLMAAYCLVNGQQPHLVPYNSFGPGPALAGGDFERWAGSAPAGWDKVGGYQGRSYSGAAEHDTETRHGGAASLKLENTEPEQIVQVSQNVTVGGGLEVGHTYRLSAWVKSGGLSQPNGIALGIFAPGLKPTGSARIDLPQQAGEWVRGEATFGMPPGSELLRIMIHIVGPGTVWVDDLRLEEIKPDGTAVEVPRPELPRDHALMRRWVELYHGEGRPWLFLGKMLHPPALETGRFEVAGRSFANVLHNAWEAPDGRRAVVLANVTDEPQTARLTWAGQTRSLSLEPWEVRLLSP